MALATIDKYTPVIQEQAYKTFLSAIKPGLIHTLPCDYFEMMERKSDTIVFSRRSNFPTFETPLPRDGSVPPGVVLTRTDIKAQMQTYGMHAPLVDDTVIYNFEDLIALNADALGQAHRETEDLLVRKCMESTSAVVNAVGGNNGDNPTNASEADFADVAAALQGNSAYTVFDTVGAMNRIGTGPLNYSYLGLCHTDLIRDFETMPEFQRRENYASDSKIPEEIGYLGRTRVFVSPKGSIDRAASGMGRDIYNIFISIIRFF